jgi:hypothetical protein
MKPPFEPTQQTLIAAKVQRLDLEPIIYKLVNPEDGEGWTVDRADAVAVLYREFLILSCLYPGKSIVPTKDIDTMWHTHILDTSKYRDDCNEVFGYFLDHFPYFGLRGEEDAKNLKAAFEETKMLFEEHFGKPVAVPMSACGPSCNSSLCENNGCNTNSCKPSRDVGRPRLARVAA